MGFTLSDSVSLWHRHVLKKNRCLIAKEQNTPLDVDLARDFGPKVGREHPPFTRQLASGFRRFDSRCPTIERKRTPNPMVPSLPKVASDLRKFGVNPQNQVRLQIPEFRVILLRIAQVPIWTLRSSSERCARRKRSRRPGSFGCASCR